MAQNIYDDAEFFAAYAALPRSQEGLDAAPEWPTLRALLPPLQGLDVVDLGCGYGWFCRWAAAHGARSVLGIDLSQRMLDRARADTAGGVRYVRADLDTLQLPASSADVAYSSLTLHYVERLDALLTTAHTALRPGGSLVCSVEHPMFTAPAHPGFVDDAGGVPTWPVSGYLDEGPRTTDWLAPGVVKQHRMIGSYVRLLHSTGFELTALIEWAPSPEQVTEHPQWACERQRPPFLLLGARRPAGS